jgi:uncharacterized protein (TIGR02001 family)
MQVKLEGLRATAAAVAVAMSVVVGATTVNAADPAQNAGEKESKGSGPDFSVNATYTSDYRFRGFTQTREKPALQGGFDVTWPNFYVGLWASSLDMGQVYNSSGFHDVADLEMIAYAGVKRNIAGFKFDLGALYYFYPGSYGDYNKPVYLGGMIKDLNYFEGMLSISKEIHKDLTLTTTTYYSPDYSGTGQNWAIENMVSRKLGTYRVLRPRSAPCSPPTSAKTARAAWTTTTGTRACRSCSPTTSSSTSAGSTPSTCRPATTARSRAAATCATAVWWRASPSRIDAGGHARAPG